jgi:hypothetical protein
MWMVVPLAGAAGAVLLHGVAMRLPVRMDAVLRFLLVGVPIGIAIVVWAARNGFTAHALAATALYAFLCELYIFCFTLVIGSISVATLVPLRESDVDETVFLARADTSAMVQVRLARLVKNGFVLRKDGRYALTPKGMRLHNVFTALRRFFRHDAP